MPATTLTEAELAKISTQAIEAKATAYCPYSKFRVGACILTEEGVYITGANVENVSYPVGTCAERCAFAKAITSGHRNFKAVAVATDITPGASPCGMCRQFIREFCRPSVPIYMYDKDNNYRMQTIGELIPLAFGPDNLPPPDKAGQ